MVNQYMPSPLKTTMSDVKINISQQFESYGQFLSIVENTTDIKLKPNYLHMILTINCDVPKYFKLKIRKSWWLSSEMNVLFNNKPIKYVEENGYFVV